MLINKYLLRVGGIYTHPPQAGYMLYAPSRESAARRSQREQKKESNRMQNYKFADLLKSSFISEGKSKKKRGSAVVVEVGTIWAYCLNRSTTKLPDRETDRELKFFSLLSRVASIFTLTICRFPC